MRTWNGILTAALLASFVASTNAVAQQAADAQPSAQAPVTDASQAGQPAPAAGQPSPAASAPAPAQGSQAQGSQSTSTALVTPPPPAPS